MKKAPFEVIILEYNRLKGGEEEVIIISIERVLSTGKGGTSVRDGMGWGRNSTHSHKSKGEIRCRNTLGEAAQGQLS